jgi:hypothetical protein
MFAATEIKSARCRGEALERWWPVFSERENRGKSIPDFRLTGVYFGGGCRFEVETELNLKAEDTGSGAEVELGAHLPDIVAALFAQRLMVLRSKDFLRRS